MGITHAYEHHQDRLVLKEGLLVAIILSGLVLLGGQQQRWKNCFKPIRPPALVK